MHHDTVWPNDPAPRIAYILRADANIWHLLSGECFGGIWTTTGVTPPEAKLYPIIREYEVYSLLAVRPRNPANASSDQPKNSRRHATGHAPTQAAPRHRLHLRPANREPNQPDRQPQMQDGGKPSPTRGQGRQDDHRRWQDQHEREWTGHRQRQRKRHTQQGTRQKYGQIIIQARAPELIGADTQDSNGENPCYGINLGTCSAARPGGKCDKWWRNCMRR
jgi:hypothetical protein